MVGSAGTCQGPVPARRGPRAAAAARRSQQQPYWSHSQSAVCNVAELSVCVFLFLGFRKQHDVLSKTVRHVQGPGRYQAARQA